MDGTDSRTTTFNTSTYINDFKQIDYLSSNKCANCKYTHKFEFWFHMGHEQWFPG